MKGHARRFFLLFGLLLVLLGLSATTGYAQPQTQQKISAPGQYSGYTSPEYKSQTVTSQYVTMRDGVRIAVDVYMPADGPARDKFPTVLIMTSLPPGQRDGQGGGWTTSRVLRTTECRVVSFPTDTSSSSPT